MENLITIVIPSYNEENYIYNTLWRISRQKFDGKIRVLIVVTGLGGEVIRNKPTLSVV